MTDFFFQMGLSNACFSLVLAIVAMVVGAKARRPHLAHLLWLLVLVKLVTPPIVTIPIVTIPGQPDSTVIASKDHSRQELPVTNNREFDVNAQPAASLSSRIGSVAWNHARVWLPPIWLLGSVVVFAWSMVRVCRFSRLLAAESEVAPQELQTAAAKIARRLELNTIPTICTTSARLSPMVWWTGGKVRIVIPTALLEKMDAHEWQWILAHELAHVRRRDYLVRWLEWLACVCFWWNPVVWWARYNLRANEEICCDALVVSSLKPTPKSYANSLLTAIECLARPALRPPAMASEINSGGFLERRFKMIVSETPKRSNTRWLQACVLLCAMVVLPLGIASAQDYEAVGKRLRAAVKAGELTGEQARAMMGTLKKAGANKKDIDIDAIGRKIRAAVQAGKITKEEGRAKMAAIKKEAGAKKDQDSDRAEAYLMKVKKELGELVEAGSISREDAAKRYEGAKKGLKARMAGRGERQRGDDKQREYEGFERRIKAAVREGKMTRVEAGEQLKGFRRRMEMAKRGERDSKRISREDFANAAGKIRKAIAEGKMSEEEGRAKLAGMRKMIGERSERAARKDVDWEGIKKRIEGAVKSSKMTRAEADAKYKEIKERMAGQGERGSRRITREGYARVEARLRKAVAEGKISGEDARARLQGMRKRMAEQGERQRSRERGRITREDWEGIKKRIEGAVNRGDLTREEADAKYKAIKERMAKSDRGSKERDPRAVYEAAEKEIRAAIAAGKITEEQGKARLEGLRKRLAQEAREAWIRENLGDSRGQGARGERTRGEGTRGERTRGDRR